MTNINLSSADVEKKPSLEVSGSGQVFIFLALIFILAVYGGEMLYGKKLDTDIANAKAQYDENYKNLSGPQAMTVVDFNERLKLAKKELATGKNIRESLEQIEKSIIPGVYLASYDFNDSTNQVILDCVGDNYNTAAKQILSFKKSAAYADVSGGETTYQSEENKVGFKINLKLK